MKQLIAKIIPHLSLLYKLLSLLVTVVLIQLMFHSDNHGVQYSYSEGSFWAYDDLYAPFDFVVRKSEKAISIEKDQASRESILYFMQDSTALATALRNLENSKLDWQDRKIVRSILEDIYAKDYIEPPADIERLDEHRLVVLKGNIGSEHRFGDFVAPSQIENIVEAHHWGNGVAAIEMNSRMLKKEILVPSVRFDAIRTKLELDSRLSQINYASRMLQRGELIVQKGEYLDADKCSAISALVNEKKGQTEEHFNPMWHRVGMFLLSMIAFIALYMFLSITNHAILSDDRKVTFVFVVVLLTSGMVALILRIAPSWVLMAPVCIAPILMRVFFDMRVALYIQLTLVIILGNLVPDSYEFIFYQLVTGIMSIVTVKNFERRSDFFLVALTIFLSYSTIYTAGILSQDTTLATIDPQRYLMFFINALLTLLSFPLIYLFEKLFKMATSLTLMEISSTNTPALRELSHVAPGTFQHSMQVANISEDIINEIGGNALLARVGALYHDIGKSTAPLNFTENQTGSFNPHNELDYEESARVITAHVTDGIELAKKYRLPSEVIDFIRTHHGTTKTGYFYAQWVNSHPNEEPNMSAFQYAGPSPYSRETAVVMLVDSTEAACKSLKQPTRENIQKMVNSVIDGKIADKQLDFCDITFGDIQRIRELLVNKLSSVYHVRVEYPTINKK